MVDKVFLQEIRDRLPLSAFIGQHIQLKKAGRNHKGNCPFHHEKTPSFMVSDDKQIYHCFGCGAGGDIFSFAMKHRGLSFPEAIELLANQAGVQIPRDFTKKTDDRSDDLNKTLEATAKFFHECLFGKHGGEAKAYLKKRGLKHESVTTHLLGYAPQRDALVHFLTDNKHMMDSALELGLVRKREDGSFYDFFRGRLMFPIFSARGRPIAFSGRALSDGQEPKYLNSPESDVFHKSHAIYGLDKAIRSIRLKDQVLIVEGQIDAISLQENGIENAIAPLGTALTVGHIHALARITQNLVLIFDGDEAGRKAAWRLLPVFIEEGLMPKAALMPEGEDPDSFVRKNGAGAVEGIIKDAPILLEFIVNLILKAGLDNEKKLSVVKQLAPIIQKTTDPIEKNLYFKIVSEKLGILETMQIAAKIDAPSRSIPSVKLTTPEQLLVKTIIRHPDLYEKHRSSIHMLTIEDDWTKSILDIFSKEIFKKNEKSTHLFHEIADDNIRKEISAISLEPAFEDEPEAILLDCIRMIERQGVEKEIAAIDNKLREGKSTGLTQEEEFELLRLRGDLEKRRRGFISGGRED